MNAQECARDEVVLGLTSSELTLAVLIGGLGVAAILLILWFGSELM